MADERDGYRDEEDIHEERGWLPTWYTMLMWAGILFAPVYAIYMHGISDWSQAKQYKADAALHAKLHPEVNVSLTKEGKNPYRDDAAAVARGKKTFQTVCGACHRPDGTGLIGPNLMDAAWLHGNTDKELFHVVMEGIAADKTKQKPTKGPMPPNKDSLGARKVLEVLAYLAAQNKSVKVK